MVLDRRIDALEDAVRLSPMPCGPQQGPGSPPACPAGAPDSALVDVFPVVTCEGELRPAVAVRGTLDQTVPTIGQLTGVYRAPQASLHYLPVTPVPGDHVVVFSRQVAGQANLGVGFVIEGSALVGLVFGCQADPTQIVPPGTEVVFLPGG
jgi:hypothetical protein